MSTPVPCSEKRAKFTPWPSHVAPRGYGAPRHTRTAGLRLRCERDFEPLRLETGGEAGLLDRPDIRLVGLDDLLFHELEQRIVQRQHPQLLAGLNDRRDLERLALADQVRDRGCGEQDLARGDAPAAHLLAER